MTKPNIVMVIADDMGYWSMGCSGDSDIKTPNLDKLAAEGMLFPDFFCASPVCSPARASILCGKMPSQHGVHDWLAKGYVDYEDVSDELKKEHRNPNASWEYKWSKSQLVGDHAIQYLDGFRAYTEILEEHGYTCALSGKWHLGDAKTPQKGFTFWKTIAMGGDNYYYPVVLKDGKFDMLRGKYITDYITENAMDFLKERDASKPFYLSVHYTAPHAPWNQFHHPAEYYDMYNDCEYTATPNVPPHKWGRSQYTQEDRRRNLHGYYAAVSAMDNGIGQIIAELKKQNVWNDTIFIFTADNGMSMGHHGIFGKGNGTFPLNMYDTAVKVPAIIAYPKGIKGGSVAKGLYSHYDIMPTIADMMGEKLDDSYPGHSFKEIFDGKIPCGKDAVIVFDEYGPVRMIRTTEYKYIHRYPYGENEFYDLKNDPDEEHNLVDSKDAAIQSKIGELKLRMEEWFEKHSDPDKDGLKQAVYGEGQLCKVGREGGGQPAFAER